MEKKHETLCCLPASLLFKVYYGESVKKTVQYLPQRITDFERIKEKKEGEKFDHTMVNCHSALPRTLYAFVRQTFLETAVYMWYVVYTITNCPPFFDV